MTQQPTRMLAPRSVQYRLARHYMDKLRAAAVSVEHGGAAVAYGLALFDQDWEQIQHWYRWAAQYRASDDECARLCKEFPVAGFEVLTMRASAADQAIWLEAALEAARQLHDDDTERSICHALRLTYYRLGELEKVERFANLLLTLGRAANDRLSVGRGYHGLGTLAEERGHYAEAQQHYEHALNLFSDLGIDIEAGRALNGLGSIAFYRGEYASAYGYLSHNLELMEARGKKSELCTALLAVGEVLTAMKAYAEAETYIRRAIEICRTFGLQRLYGVGKINLGAWALDQHQLEYARTCFEDGIQAVHAVGTQRQVIHGLAGLGCTHLRMGHYDDALVYLGEGLDMALALDMPRSIGSLQRTLADTYLAIHRLDAARYALHEALVIAQSLESSSLKVKALATAVDYAERLDLNETAALWSRRIMGDAALDEWAFEPARARLEATLGSERYHDVTVRGERLSLEECVAQALAFI